MSHGKIREDKNCLNCGHQVEERYCSHCGQENSETRKPFHYLFTHFVEDLVHYDGKFWTTLKYLMFYPGKLTKEYLNGKRASFVLPVKLYIFVSFFVFFVPSLLETDNSYNHKDSIIKVELGENSRGTKNKKQKLTKEQTEKLEKDLNDSWLLRTFLKPMKLKLDEMEKHNYSDQEFKEKLSKSISKTLPKALFLYLPIFAFIMWLFYDKKKWWFFDHGIFTFHLFSFLLLAALSIELITYVLDFLPINTVLETLIQVIEAFGLIYIVYYYFKAQRKVYHETGKKNILKGGFLLITNIILMIIGFGGVVYYSFLNM